MKARRMVGNMEYTLLAVPLELTVARASAYQDEEVRPALVMNLHFSILMAQTNAPSTGWLGANRRRFGFGTGDREWPLNEAQRPHFRGGRVALDTGYNRVKGIGAKLTKGGNRGQRRSGVTS
jgi:hypothetical protein